SSAVPRMSTDWYGFSVADAVWLTLGSRVRFLAFWRPAVVENSTKSPSLTIQITVVCGPPSGFSVATVATFLPSSSLRVSSLNFTGTASPFYSATRVHCLHATGARAESFPAPGRGLVLPVTPDDRPLRHEDHDLRLDY